MHRFSDADLRKLIIPLFLEQLLVMLVGIADTFMVSFAGDAAVSGVSLVNMFVVFIIYVLTALASGGAVIISQYMGRGDRKEADHTAGQLLMICGMVSLAFTVVVLLLNRQILNLLFGRVEPEVMAACVTYQWIMALSFLPMGIYNAGAALCRCINRTDVTLKASILSNLINVVGNAIGIFVLHAGVAGVAWPTLLARIFSAVMVTGFCFGKDLEVSFRVKYIYRWSRDMVQQILHVAVPNSIENGIFQLVKIALSSVTALFGTAQIAANGIAQSIWSLAALMVVVMGPVYITVIGQCMGAGDIDEADYYFKKLMKITSVTAILWNILVFVLTPLIMSFYPLSEEIRSLVVRLVIIHNIFNALAWPFGGALPSGLRAAGDIRFNMMVTVVCTIFVRLALSVILGVRFQMGVMGIAWAMVLDWTTRSVISYLRYRQGKWKTMRVI